MQEITITGNIVENAGIRKNSTTGKDFLAFRVAVHDNTGDKKTTFYKVSSQKLNMKEYLTRGKQVLVRGKFTHTLTYDNDGTPFVNLYIFENYIELLGTKQTTSINNVQGETQSYYKNFEV